MTLFDFINSIFFLKSFENSHKINSKADSIDIAPLEIGSKKAYKTNI
jgi:hypothetical protein